MIETRYVIRLDMKYKISNETANKLLEKCATAMEHEKTLSVWCRPSDSVCAPFVEVVVDNAELAVCIEVKLKRIIGCWLE